MSAHEPVTIHVTYTGTARDRFDRTYYAGSHLPLVMDAWGPHGLLGVTVFYPDRDAAGSEEAGTIAICECVFRDETALAAAFASERVPEVMADVERFTNLVPRRSRAVPL